MLKLKFKVQGEILVIIGSNRRLAISDIISSIFPSCIVQLGLFHRENGQLLSIFKEGVLLFLKLPQNYEIDNGKFVFGLDFCVFD